MHTTIVRWLAMSVILAVGCTAAAPDNAKSPAMSLKISGTFDVKMLPLPANPKLGDDAPGRYSLEKKYHGRLDATSTGEMLTANTDVKDSAGYVALEKVTGKLGGRAGTFWLQHSGIMSRGEAKLTVVVVPDSGTGELKGLSGSMTIKVTDTQHSYELDYRLPPK